MTIAIRVWTTILLAAVALAAQQTVTGVVQDTSGAPVAKAKLTLTSKDSGEALMKAATGLDGAFRFEAVPDGSYQIEAQAKSLAPGKKKVVVAGAPVQVKLELALETQSEQVTVTAATGKVAEEAVSADRNADRLNFEDEALDSLPAPGNNPLGVVAAFLSPAAQGAEGVSITVDGVESSAAALPASAIRRIRLNRNPYSVQFRRPGKARLEVVSEEGSLSRYRGAFGIAVRNSVFDARNAFAPVRPALNRTLFDFNIGGPITRKRSAFYFNGEHYRNNETAVVNARTLAGPLMENVLTPERRSRYLGRIENRGESHQTVATYSYFDQSEKNRGAGGLKLASQGIPASETSHRVQFSDRVLLFGRLLNDLRVTATREEVGRGFDTEQSQPALEVHGAFTGGAPQTFRFRRETSTRIQNIANLSKGRHQLRFGAEARPAFFRSIERQNFGGTYEFASLDAFAANQALFYRINRGNPAVSQAQHEAFGFIQDETTLAKGLSVTYGVRYGWQSDVRDRNNIAPRGGVAFAPGGGKTVIRGGAGIFHERVTEDAARRSLLFDGSRLVESIYLNPLYPSPGNTGGGGFNVQPPPSVVRRAGDLIAPVLTQASLGVEREVWKRTTLAVEYQHLRGNHLLRARNINSPLAAGGLRPDPSLLAVSQIESTASMRGNALTATFRGALKKWLTATAQYTLSRTEDDSSGPFDNPASPFNLASEWGRSDYDQRHRFQLAGMIAPAEGYRLGLFVTGASGIPFNITTGRDDNGDSITRDRPAGTNRNTGLGPGLARVDLRFTRLMRAPRFLERQRKHTSRNMELNIDAFNLFNHTNFSSYVGVLTSPFYGRAAVALAPRTVQISIRYKL